MVNAAPIRIESVRIQHFRGIIDLNVELEPDLTILVGQNNAGKSRVLRAIGIATGALSPDRDDFTVDVDAEPVIDTVLAPATGETFDPAIARRLLNVQPGPSSSDAERFAWRTTIFRTREGFGSRSETAVLAYNTSANQWEPAVPTTSLSGVQRSLVVGDYVGTGRDLVDDFARRGSAIRRILDDLEVDEDSREALEVRLGDLSKDIIGSSAALDAVTRSLQALSQSVGSVGSAEIKPLPLRLEELSRSVVVDLDTGAGALPLRVHGAGSRSMTSIQLQSVLYDRRVGSDGGALRPHAVSLLEEPEAHLHPQGQVQLSEVLHSLPGQAVVSTHSSHLVSTVEPRSLRMFRWKSTGVSLVNLRPAEDALDADTPRMLRPALYREEMEKLRRQIERPFGELLFASCVVLGDGATERALLPVILRHCLGLQADRVAVIDAGSMNSPMATAVVKFAEATGLPWHLFADDDEAGRRDATRLDATFGSGDQSHITWVFGATEDDGATERMLFDFDSDACMTAATQFGYEGAEDQLLKYMAKHKGVLGAALGRELTRKYPDQEKIRSGTDYWPQPLVELVSAVRTKLEL
ncbi:ATP-dependent nuclease [Curtobacterium poinsettiae]|uniref:ATP-dependent nuclease n=1 Tax=Curtobacterium poinsettiae TaxID=159612 RepID=UPI0039A14FAD